MDGSVALGPFDVVKESFSSRWKLENSRTLTTTFISVRMTTKDKELRIEPKDSNMKEVFVTTGASCDDFEQGKSIFSVVLPVYKIRLSFSCSRNPDIITKLYKQLFVEAHKAINRTSVIIPKPNLFRSCPIRSDVLMTCTDEILSPEMPGSRYCLSKASSSSSSSTSSVLFGINGARAKEKFSLYPHNMKNMRSFRSGLTPPEKKPNHRRSPQHQQQENMHQNSSSNVFIENNENNAVRNKESFYQEDDDNLIEHTNCAKNLSSLLDEQVIDDQLPMDHNKRDSLRLGDIFLTAEQSAIIASVQSGQNVFFTGGAGTGKSTLLKHIIQYVRQAHDSTEVFVTATTGLAACAIQGSTLHQLFGIPAVSEDSDPSVWEAVLQKTLDKRSVTQRLRSAKVIIIDEISMLGPHLFEFIDKCLRRARHAENTPMGGVQIICCGDFFQLPPVQATSSYNKANRSNANNGHQHNTIRNYITNNSIKAVSSIQNNLNNDKSSIRYSFQSSLWAEVFPMETNAYILTNIYRQQADPTFAALLEEIRVGQCSIESLQQLNEQCLQQELTPGIHGVQATQILTHKRDVDAINAQQLSALRGDKMVYHAQDTGDAAFVQMLQKHCPAKTCLELKVGAQVILVKTTQPSQGLVNGARGVIVRFMRETRWPIVRFSREGFNGESSHNSSKTDNSSRVLEIPITLETFPVMLSGKIMAQRVQLPLDLAWAVSVHRAQGMTVDYGEVDVRHAFEFGQIYVALSRVRSRAGLSLRHAIQPSQIKVDTCVQEFYRALKIAQERGKQQSKAEQSKMKKNIVQKNDHRIRKNLVDVLNTQS